MKIAIILDSVARAGAERQAIHSARELSRRGHEVELIYYHKCNNEYDLSNLAGAKAVFIPKNRTYLRFLYRLMKHLTRGSFDVAHAFKSTPCIYGCLAAHWARIPVVLGGYRVEYDSRGLIRLLHRLVDRVVSAWVVNSRAIVESMVRAIGMRRECCYVVYNGIDPGHFASDLSPYAARHRLGIDPASATVSIFARLRPQKNHEMFLELAVRVCESLPDSYFLIVGDGEQLTKMKSRAKSMGLSKRVLFLGNRSDIADLLAATDVSVLTSHYEGLSNTLLEAMAVGVPVVTTDYSGVEEVVTDGWEGFIVPRGDADAMASQVVRLLRDESLRKRMGDAGRKRVQAQFSLEAMTDSLLAVYEACLAKALVTA